MSQYRNLGQRRASGAWQWLVIGFFPGLLCGGLIIFLLVAFGPFNALGGEPEVIEVTREPITIVQVVSPTPDPAATQPLVVVTATDDPSADTGSVVVPTLTPVVVAEETEAVSSEPVQVNVTTQEPDTTENTTTDTTSEQPTTDASAQTDSNLPPQLAAVAGQLVQVQGGTFQFGTTTTEIFEATNNCQSRDGGNCVAADAEDSLPQVAVTLDTFWMEQNEVTFNQYVAFLNYQNSLGSRHTSACGTFLCIQTQNERPDAAVIAFDGANYFIPTTYETLRNHPAYGVTWYGAQAYCQSLGRRLPTEAEWEYAARAGGSNVKYPWGDNWNPDFANVRLPLVEGTGDATVAIDARPFGINALGMTHMAGNVAEWVNDYYSSTYYSTLSQQQQASGQPILNPTGPAGGTTRVLRGGSFNALPFFARTYHRQAFQPVPELPSSTYPLWVGFRCASNTGPNETTGIAPSGVVDPASLGPTVPATGEDANNNAQPAAPETATEEGSDGSRG